MKKIIILVTIFYFFPGCQWQPKRENYSSRAEFIAADCLYRSDKPDLCADDMKEARAVGRYNDCKNPEYRDKGHDFEKCWVYRNQK